MTILLLLLLLILLVLLFGRRYVLELVEWAFAEWLLSMIFVVKIIFVLGHIALLLLVYPVVLSFLGENVAAVALVTVASWQGYLLWTHYCVKDMQNRSNESDD
jgi:hypothetical protein